MADLGTLFDGVNLKMMNDFKFITSQISHRATKGHVREEIVRDFLREYLPPSLGIGSGIVLSSVDSEQESKQIDVVIYDKNNCPMLFNLSGVQLFPIEMVYCVIEVKSRLTSSELKKACANIESVKVLSKKAYIKNEDAVVPFVRAYGREHNHWPVFGVVFAFSGITAPKIVTQLETLDATQLNIEKRIDCIVVLDGFIVANSNGDDTIQFTPDNESKRRVLISEQRSLLAFYLLLWSDLSGFWTKPLNVKDYFAKVNLGYYKK